MQAWLPACTHGKRRKCLRSKKPPAFLCQQGHLKPTYLYPEADPAHPGNIQLHPMRNSYRVHAALFFVALIYAANYSLSKDVMPKYMGPFGIVTLRIVGATLFFAIIKYFVAPQDKIIGRADNLRALACGVLGIGVNQLLFFSGLNLTSPISASLLQTIAPITK